MYTLHDRLQPTQGPSVNVAQPDDPRCSPNGCLSPSLIPPIVLSSSPRDFTSPIFNQQRPSEQWRSMITSQLRAHSDQTWTTSHPTMGASGGTHRRICTSDDATWQTTPSHYARTTSYKHRRRNAHQTTVRTELHRTGTLLSKSLSQGCWLTSYTYCLHPQRCQQSHS